MDNQQYNTILENVPGSVKAKLDRILRYLHLGKASVMIGAGFSCNADYPANMRIKQWSDIGKELYCKLQAVDKVNPAELSFKTPMRLASQYAAVNGRNELDNLIRASIPDESMTPGALHRQLLSLPWRDVFTTNYDTLLERTCNEVKINYSVVTSKEMLLYKSSPRIIKLHGSFPDKTPFLMTEEDYMSYPKEHPEFVNTVRQALVESIFCLVGFSGDDPNFTSWQSWLKDVMGEYAGPSYLITFDKNYDDSFRTLMSRRGVDVINFSEIDGLTDYKSALDFFFTYLDKKESVWKGEVENYTRSTSSAGELTNQLKKVREEYPGWFILPKEYYWQFDDMRYEFPYIQDLVEGADDREREDLLFELDWRADISLTFKDYDWYRENLEKIIEGYGESPLSEKAITLGISLLRLYRHHFNEADKASSLQARLKRELSKMSNLQQSKFYYTAACNALSMLDYDAVYKTLSEWTLTSKDYEGALYRALVVAECEGPEKAVSILNEATDRITLSLTQKENQRSFSLRRVMENMLAFYKGEGMSGEDNSFSFIELSNYFLSLMGRPAKEEFEITHAFGVNTLTTSWNCSSGIKEDLFYAYCYLLLCEAYALPFGMAKSSVDEKILQETLKRLTKCGVGYALGPMLRSGSEKVVESYITRESVCLLTRVEADGLAEMLLSRDNQESFEPARKYHFRKALVPLLSRLSTKCSTEIVVKIFKFVLGIFKQTDHNGSTLKLIYDNLLPEGTQTVYDEVFDSQIRAEEERWLFPYDAFEEYAPGRFAVEIVCNGLSSGNEDICQSAYIRAHKLLKSKIDASERAHIIEAIHRWRDRTPLTQPMKKSFADVEPNDEELDGLQATVADDVAKFVACDYGYTNSSLSASSLKDDIYNITLEARYLTKEQVTAVLEKISDALDKNLEKYSQDDSNIMFGGLRRYTGPAFQWIGEFIRLTMENDLVEPEPAYLLFQTLQKYLPSHLPVRITMARLNKVCETLKQNELREKIIEAHLFSDNEGDVIDACNALVYYTYNYRGFQTVLCKIIDYCKHAESDKLYLYLSTLSQIPVNVMTLATQDELATMMKVIIVRVPNRRFSEEIKVDIMHEGMRLAASLPDRNRLTVLDEAVEQWRELANDVEIFNDVRRPWFVRG